MESNAGAMFCHQIKRRGGGQAEGATSVILPHMERPPFFQPPHIERPPDMRQLDVAERFGRSTWKDGEVRKDASAGIARAFGMGLKPGFLISGMRSFAHPEILAPILRENGVNALIYPRLIVNRDLVLARLRRESDIARLLGWKEDDTVESVAERVGQKDETDSMAGLRGFILGFPTSAILGYLRTKGLEARGFPSAFDFRSKARHPALWLRITAQKDQRRLLDFLKEHPSGPGKKPFPERAFADLVFELLGTYWPELTPDERDSLAYQPSLHIKDPFGDSVYVLKTYGKQGLDAPDIFALKEEVRRAYEGFWATPPDVLP